MSKFKQLLETFHEEDQQEPIVSDTYVYDGTINTVYILQPPNAPIEPSTTDDMTLFANDADYDEPQM